MPPPPELPVAKLPEMVELVRLTVPLEFTMPPPERAELKEIAQPVTVKLPQLKMPPPRLKLVKSPLVMVRPEMVTLMLPQPVEKMPNLGIGPKKLRCTVNRFAPGPLIVRF